MTKLEQELLAALERIEKLDGQGEGWARMLGEYGTIAAAAIAKAKAEEYDNNHAPCANCGEGCDPMAATPTQWQCNDCEHWNDKEQG